MIFTHYCAYDAQMLSRRITFADLAAVGRLDRHRLRNLLKDIPEFATRPAAQRVASEYSRIDLMVVAVLCELERMGLRKDAIARWVTPIQRALGGPRHAIARQLILKCDPCEAAIDEPPPMQGAWLILDLQTVLGRVDDYCNGEAGQRDSQRDLEYGPTGLVAAQHVRSGGSRTNG